MTKFQTLKQTYETLSGRKAPHGTSTQAMQIMVNKAEQQAKAKAQLEASGDPAPDSLRNLCWSIEGRLEQLAELDRVEYNDIHRCYGQTCSIAHLVVAGLVTANEEARGRLADLYRVVGIRLVGSR